MLARSNCSDGVTARGHVNGRDPALPGGIAPLARTVRTITPCSLGIAKTFALLSASAEFGLTAIYTVAPRQYKSPRLHANKFAFAFGLLHCSRLLRIFASSEDLKKKMRGIFITMALAPAFLLATGCATEKETPANEAEKRYFDAWMQKYHPDAVATEHWVYIIDDIPATGTSTEAADKDYVFVTYTEKDLSGNISGTNDIEIAKKLNQYNETYYYGPAIWNRSSIMSGVMYAIEGMNIGDFRSVIIPGWLMSYNRYSSEKDYLANVTGGSNAIYDIKITGQTDDIMEWQVEEMEKFIDGKPWQTSDDFKDFIDDGGLFMAISKADSTEKGFYYEGRYADGGYDTPQTLGQGQEDEDGDTDEDASPFPSDTTVYINYTGRLMNGQVFDTTIERTAKDYGIYTAGKEYKPLEVSWGSSYGELKLDGNSVISGFSKTLWRMSQGRKTEGEEYNDVANATGLFWSTLGYGYSGSGNVIPAYAPLIFEIEFTEGEE